MFLIFFSRVYASSDVIESWGITSSLPNANASLAGNSKDGLFLFGGATSDDISEIFRGQTNNVGEILNWSSQGNLLSTKYWINSVLRSDKIYILGGAVFNGSTNFSNDVWSATIDNSGTVGSWSSLNPLPQALAHGGVFIANDRLYFAGGLGNGIVSDIIYSAPINPDGTIGSWVNSGILPDQMYAMAIYEYQGKVFLLGGVVNGVGVKNVYSADLGNDGSISAWTQLSDAPVSLAGNQSVLLGDTFYCVTGNTLYYSKINNNLEFDTWSASSNQLPQSIGAGRLLHLNGYLYLIGGHNGSSYLDTVYFTKIQDDASGEIKLNVPLLKQTDPLWSNEIYNSAQKWASQNPGIGRWGCAMTSAAMVFRYHGITKLPDGSELNPKSLNEWLKSEPSGYVGNGLVNWLALTRLSKLAKSQNPDFHFDALEYSRINSDKQSILRENIDNNLPTILGEPGHFVVGTGYSDSTVFINDPGFAREDLSEYATTFLSMGTYTPSNTDLSYIMIVNSSNINMGVVDSQGQPVGFTVEEGPIIDPESGQSSGTPLPVIYVQKPENGQYKIEISSPDLRVYEFEVLLYDLEGNVVSKKITGIVGEDDLDVYTIDFNKQGNVQNGIEKEVTFDSLIKDIEFYYQNSNIKTFAVKKLLVFEVKHIQVISQKSTRLAKIHLSALIQVVRALSPRHIDITASQSLIQTISSLKSSL